MDTKTFKQNLLDQLYAPYKNCMQCPLGNLGRTNVVFGQGNPEASIMLIGEGPGADEDAQGIPFIGRSGQLLTKALITANIQREELFITNVVKCRPPDNRAPRPLETITCKRILLTKQINIIQPKVICTLGSSAIAGLLEQKVQITKIRGTPIKWNNIIVLPTYHPAYVMRNPKELETLRKDLQQAAILAK